MRKDRTTPRLNFARDRRGAAMVEFAFVAPLLILFYVGMAELCQALMAERKSAHAASAVADLVAQSNQVTVASVNEVLNIAPAVLEPFESDGKLKIRVSSVLVDEDDDTPRVQWSESDNWTDRTDNEVVDLPEVPDGDGQKDFLAPGESVIMAEVQYAFSTPFSGLFADVKELVSGQPAGAEGYDFSATYYLRPRRSDQVTCDDC